MLPRIRHYRPLAFSCMAALVILSFGITAANELRLFSVQKSENKNELVYFIRADEACRPARYNPVFVRWHMRERGESAWEELLVIERSFYALAEQRPLDAQRVQTSVRAAPEHPFIVRIERSEGGCMASAEADIAGVRAVIASVAVEVGFLSVKHATIFGRTGDGSRIAENIR
jgi:hypothetical protein